MVTSTIYLAADYAPLIADAHLLYTLAYAFPAQTREGFGPLAMGHLGWADYVNSANLRELTQGEG